jgi:VIT1/CCC1 family predicted Fe2+/Mn2+ transporter
LQGCEARTWTADDLSSYITISPPTAEADIFTELITDWLASIFRRLFGRRFRTGKIVDEEAGLRSYSHTRLRKASNVIAVIVAAILPVLTIFILNSVKRTTVRIGLTVLFATVFAVVLALFTSVKPGEIFAATAT